MSIIDDIVNEYIEELLDVIEERARTVGAEAAKEAARDEMEDAINEWYGGNYASMNAAIDPTVTIERVGQSISFSVDFDIDDSKFNPPSTTMPAWNGRHPECAIPDYQSYIAGLQWPDAGEACLGLPKHFVASGMDNPHYIPKNPGLGEAIEEGVNKELVNNAFLNAIKI